MTQKGENKGQTTTRRGHSKCLNNNNKDQEFNKKPKRNIEKTWSL